MTTDTGAAATMGEPQGRRWLWIVLTVSLALNLLFIGLMAGGVWTRWHGGPRHFSFSGSIERLMADMSSERRQHAEDLLGRYREEVRPMWRNVGATRRALVDAIVAEPYDGAAVQEALGRFQDAREVARGRLSHYMLEFIEELTPDERRAFVEGLRRRRGGSRSK